MRAIERTAWRVAEKLRAWKRRRYWTTSRQIEHLRTMLDADNRWMSHDTTANSLTQRYLDALAHDWYRRVYEDTPDLRRRLGIVPSYGLNTVGRCASNRDEEDAELARLRKIETAAKLATGLLWMTGEWRQGKADAAYQALLEAVGGSGSQGLRESIEAALAAGHEVDAPPGCYWPKE